MKRETRSRCRLGIMRLEEMEPRTLLSAVPYVFHALKGLGNPAVNKARVAGLFSGATGLTYSYALPPSAGQSGTVILGYSGPEEVATFFSTAPLADMTATIDWGDGSASVGTIAKVVGHRGNAHEYTISGEHAYAAPGTVQVVIHVTVHSPVGTASQTIDAEANVSAAAGTTPVPPVAGPYVIGETINKIVGLAYAPPLNLLADTVGESNVRLTHVMIDWGDGTAPTPGVVEMSGGLLGASGMPGGQQMYAIMGSHAYAVPGTYAVTITGVSPVPFITGETAGATVEAQGWAVVAQNSADGSDVAGNPGVALNFAGGSISLAGAAPSAFTAQINWGDGTTSAGTLVVNGAGQNGQPTYAIEGSHVYAADGNYQIAATIYRGTSTALVDAVAFSYSTALITTPTVQSAPVLQFTVTGNDVQLAATLDGTELPSMIFQASPGISEIFLIGSQNESYVATIDWGDGTTSNAVVTPPAPFQVYPFVTADSGVSNPGVSDDAIVLPPWGIWPPGLIYDPTVQISGNHTYATPGSYDVTVTFTEIYAPSNAKPSAPSETMTSQVTVTGAGGDS